MSKYPQLDEYIKKARAEGKTEDQLRAEMKGAGYNEEDIQNILSSSSIPEKKFENIPRTKANVLQSRTNFSIINNIKKIKLNNILSVLLSISVLFFLDIEIADSFQDFLLTNGIVFVFLIVAILLLSLSKIITTILTIFSLIIGLGSFISASNSEGWGALGYISVIYLSIIIFTLGILILISNYIEYLLNNKLSDKFLVIISIGLIIFNIIFWFSAINDRSIEKNIRSTNYESIEDFDIDSLDNSCRKIISPFNQEDCLGYIYYRKDILSNSKRREDMIKNDKELRSEIKNNLSSLEVIPYSEKINVSYKDGYDSYEHRLIEYKKYENHLIKREISLTIGNDGYSDCSLKIYHSISDAVSDPNGNLDQSLNLYREGEFTTFIYPYNDHVKEIAPDLSLVITEKIGSLNKCPDVNLELKQN